MSLKVAVLDMQPIDPPTGGGRLRLLGLYHALGRDLDVRYVGTYDWPGPGYRRQKLSPTLEEVLVPLSPAHFAAAKARSKALGGRGVIDTTFHELAHLSPEYLAAAREAAAEADIVVFSHPWIHPLVCDLIDPERQLIVYEAHNVEGLLRLELLDDGAAGTEIAREVVRVEYALCHAAHLILACSHEDRSAFIRLYGVPPERTRVAANGAFTRAMVPPTAEEKAAARKALGVGAGPVALFIGSQYGPNVDAARFIAETLAPAVPDVQFVIAGGVGEAVKARRANLRVTGQISDEDKRRWLQAADFGVNPMFGGSGTNIKMFDFMAVGLPIVTTPIGARGIMADGENMAVVEPDGLAGAISALVAAPDRARSMGRSAREAVERSYSWERISEQTGALLSRRRTRLGRPEPYFSVLVPTYARHPSLTSLMELLAEQSWRDFEVVVVDQSAEPWPDRDRDFGLDLLYVHTDLRGAVFARNRGAGLARGEVIAFIDDDCLPSKGWLAAAHAEFSSRDIVGLEGLITSGGKSDPDWRAVTNDGFEGIGFMTANLFVRSGVFQQLDGFDPAFDHPHFREDTDLGWRLQALGAVPFSRQAAVYHPPQPRALERESVETRSKFFEKDALLLRKHPQKYPQLLLRECQWKHNPYFWSYFFRGLDRYGVEAPEAVLVHAPRDQRMKLRDRARRSSSASN
jgi:glycosyltransferase involved in cell wall biosynthesis/GT2 family glycosyltransferase